VNANLSINATGITVLGDVYIQSGYLVIGSGAHLVVSGDFRVQAMDPYGVFGATAGYARQAPGSRLTVYGDFYTQTTSSAYFGATYYGYAAASMELHGDFRQIGADTYFWHQDESYFRIVFAGGGEQRVSFDRHDQYASLGRIEAMNDIRLLTPVYSLTLCSDLAMTMSGGAHIGSLNLAGHTVHIRSAAHLANANLAGGTLITSGDLTLDGTLTVGNSLLYAKGGLTINNSGKLSMSHADGIAIIQGDLTLNTSANMTLSSGFLDIGGDIAITTPYKLTTGANLYAQFSGDAMQHISYPSNGGVSFHNLAVPDLYHLTITRGADGFYLDYTYVNRTCTNTSCTFVFCNNHSFPTTSCGTRLYCPSQSCTYPTYGWKCNQCVSCAMCSECYKNKIFTNIYGDIYDLVPLADQIKVRYFGTAGIHSPTGNYSQSFTDMTVRTVLGDLMFTRTYNSLNSEASNVGKGFTFSYNMRIVADSGKTYVMLPNGSVWTFEESGGSYTALDSRGVLTRQGGDYALETLDQMRYVFDSSGHIKYVEDFKGNRVTITTGQNGRITALSDPTGASVSFAYNSGGKLAGITDNASGRTVSYAYSGDLLTHVTDAAGMATAYTYANGLLSSIDDNIGRRVLTLTYLNAEGKVHTVTDATGNTRTYSYDPLNMRTGITDSNGRTTYEGYSLDYAVTTSTDALGRTSSVRYLLVNGKNKYNEVQSATDIHGNTTYYERDAKATSLKSRTPTARPRNTHMTNTTTA
jgi:YD repeat-containing protein